MAFASPPPFYETVTTTMPSDAAPSAAMLSRSYQSAAAAAALAHAAAQQQQSGFSFRVENFFCFGSPLSVFLTLRWRDPSNQGGRCFARCSRQKK